MADTSTQTRSGTAESADQPPSSTTCPVLYLCIECERPLAGSARYALGGVDELTIGRGSERSAQHSPADAPRRVLRLGVPDRRVSALHARLRQSDGVWTIEDAGSKNGVLVDGKATERAALADGSLLEIGHTLFLFRSAVAMPAEAPWVLDHAALASSPRGMTTLIPSLASRFERALSMARARVPLMLLGESGTGKELLAHALHAASGRSGQLVAVNCGALPATLVESELFGFRKGAFSGATEDRVGLVRSADGGTLFLDEVGDFALSAQASLLRVLQESEVTPVGATRPVSVDLRVISATHGDLERMVERGEFRADLFARLSGGILRLPPLRERVEDIGALLPILLRSVAGEESERLTFSVQAARALLRHGWPLNIRELEKSMASACAIAKGGTIELDHLPEKIQQRGPAPPAVPGDLMQRLTGQDLKNRTKLVELLSEFGGNVSAVARRMGKGRTQIQRWIKRYDIKQ